MPVRVARRRQGVVRLSRVGSLRLLPGLLPRHTACTVRSCVPVTPVLAHRMLPVVRVAVPGSPPWLVGAKVRSNNHLEQTASDRRLEKEQARTPCSRNGATASARSSPSSRRRSRRRRQLSTAEQEEQLGHSNSSNRGPARHLQHLHRVAQQLSSNNALARPRRRRA